MKRLAFLSFLSVSIIVFATTPSLASPAEDAVNLSEQSFERWKQQFYRESLTQGISQHILEKALAPAKLNETVVRLDRNQPSKKMSFRQYRKNVLPKQRIETARKLYQENHKLLTAIGKHYGVQPRFILALWGLESGFGKNMGSFSVVDSLATLAFEGRRADLFGRELISALRILQEGHIAPEAMRGSWAGAMGQTQFMPSNFLKLAVDYNKDGKKDIWGTRADVFASIANYLHKIEWDANATWGRQVHLPKGFDHSLISIDKEKPVSTWSKLGVKATDGKALPNKNLAASLVQPDPKSPDYYLVYANYKKVLDWNRSLYFATTVGLFADAIGNGS